MASDIHMLSTWSVGEWAHVDAVYIAETSELQLLSYPGSSGTADG